MSCTTMCSYGFLDVTALWSRCMVNSTCCGRMCVHSCRSNSGATVTLSCGSPIASFTGGSSSTGSSMGCSIGASVDASLRSIAARTEPCLSLKVATSKSALTLGSFMMGGLGDCSATVAKLTDSLPSPLLIFVESGISKPSASRRTPTTPISSACAMRVDMSLWIDLANLRWFGHMACCGMSTVRVQLLRSSDHPSPLTDPPNVFKLDGHCRPRYVLVLGTRSRFEMPVAAASCTAVFVDRQDLIANFTPTSGIRPPTNQRNS
mmetsp:Transcript_12897/g.24539  ORF Transcript_12897/g.24539 Transcript_12897/m.24539 type:complete len:263 (+) Transcript_12897:974-1762(+)